MILVVLTVLVVSGNQPVDCATFCTSSILFTKDGTKETEREREKKKETGSLQEKFVVIPHLGNKPNKVNWIFS